MFGTGIKWSKNQQIRYKKILSQCDDKIVLNDQFIPTCMDERNKYMVENSSLCIACFNGSPSGTRNTIGFAKENDNKIIIVNPKNFE